jgi:hypothetical protein
LNNAFMASTPQNPFWEQVVFPAVQESLRKIEDSWLAKVSFGYRVEQSTGPLFWEKTIRPHFHWAKYGVVVLENMRVNGTHLPTHKGGLSEAESQALARAGSYGYHWSDQSWMGGLDKIWGSFNDSPYAWAAAYVLLAIIVFAVGKIAYSLSFVEDVRTRHASPPSNVPRVPGLLRGASGRASARAPA